MAKGWRMVSVEKIAKCNYCGYMKINPPLGMRKCPKAGCGHKLVFTKTSPNKKR